MIIPTFLRRSAFLFFTCCCWAALSASAATKVQTSGLSYLIGKAPEWVEKIESPSRPGSSVPGAGATQILLSDTQVNLMGPKPVAYYHGRSVSHERSDLEGISSLRIAFNPRYETLTFHELAIIRDGRRIDRMASSRIDLAQRERHLDEGVYDEDVEAIVALRDVRVGDVVEYSYSLAGENPIFSGKYSSFFVLNRDKPVARLAVRMHFPANRKFNYRFYRSDLQVVESNDRNVHRLRLDAENLPAVRREEAVPAWYGMYPWLQVTEYASWSDVAAWARLLYDVPVELGPEIESVVEGIKRGTNSPDEQTARALAWVQNEIRYYSVAVGSSSHRPNAPKLTVRQRFGDCKDKSLLLSAMLRRMGIAAEPALVSNQIRKRVGDMLPTPIVFDHVIVRAQVGGRTYWLDGTRTYQGRNLDNLGFTHFGKALVTSTATETDLVDVHPPIGMRVGTEVTETLKITKYGEPTQMRVEQKYHAVLAEWFRNQSATAGVQQVVEGLQSDYGRDFPKISLSGEAVVADDPVGNVITLTQSFLVPQPFAYESGRAKMAGLYARSIVPWLRFPGAPDRKFPLALQFPDSFEHTIVVELPNKFPVTAPSPESWQDRHYALYNRISVDGNRLVFNYKARVLQDHVAAADFASFSEKFKQASGMLFSSLNVPLIDTPQLRERLIRDFEKEKLNFRKPDQLDTLYQGFVRDFAVADESIRSGKLAGPLLAKAFVDRAQAASLMGRRSEALDDAERSLVIEPTDAAHVLKAEILLYSGRYGEALDTLGRVKEETNKANTLLASGMAYFFLGNHSEASRSFARAAEVAGAEDLPYALIWLALAERRAGNAPGDRVGKYSSRLGGGWPTDALSFVIRGGAVDSLISTAGSDEKESRLRLCEAYFYLGQAALLDGNVASARQWFAKSVDTKAVMYREHIFAQQELARLDTK